MFNVKEYFMNFEEKMRKISQEAFEKMKDKMSDLEQDITKYAQGISYSIYFYFHNIDKKSILSFVLGLGGVTIGAGLMMIPGIGFIFGLLIGVLLQDSYRDQIKSTLEKSTNRVVQNARELTNSIQDNWDQFMESFNSDIKCIEEHKDNLKTYAQDLEEKAKNIKMKIEKKLK